MRRNLDVAIITLDAYKHWIPRRSPDQGIETTLF